jgi:hypothetical protein
MHASRPEHGMKLGLTSGMIVTIHATRIIGSIPCARAGYINCNDWLWVMPIVSTVTINRALTACGSVVRIDPTIAVLWEGAITWILTFVIIIHVVLVVWITYLHVHIIRYTPYNMVMPYVGHVRATSILINTINTINTTTTTMYYENFSDFFLTLFLRKLLFNCSREHATRNTQHATRNTQHATQTKGKRL